MQRNNILMELEIRGMGEPSSKDVLPIIVTMHSHLDLILTDDLPLTLQREVRGIILLTIKEMLPNYTIIIDMAQMFVVLQTSLTQKQKI